MPGDNAECHTKLWNVNIINSPVLCLHYLEFPMSSHSEIYLSDPAEKECCQKYRKLNRSNTSLTLHFVSCVDHR